MKVGVFSDIKWSIGRVYRDIAKYLPEYEFRYISWANWSLEELYDVYNWCDVMIVNLCQVNTVPEHVDPSKILFISHGFEEHYDKVLNPAYHYAATSESIRSLFLPDKHVWITPNGVDPAQFIYTERNGSLNKLGWSGAPRVWFKQANWAVEIANTSCIPLSITSAVPCEHDIQIWEPLTYDQVRDWYSTVDLLLITSIPDAKHETGPLPAFEAIVSGVPVIGTPVGNFANVPGPKFTTVEEGIQIVKRLECNPDELVAIAKEQYEYVIKYFTYDAFAYRWKEAIQYVHNLSKDSVN